MKIKFFFAWFDFWVGFYYDQKGHALYVCPLPCCVFKFWRNPTKDAADFRKARGVLHIDGLDAVEEIRKLRGGLSKPLDCS